MPVKGAERVIRAAEVPNVFTDERIRQLIADEQIRDLLAVDLGSLADGIRSVARSYADESKAQTSNELHKEIKALRSAALKRKYEQAAILVGKCQQKHATC